jgi:polyisoprenoid-binding protein YceI
MFEHRVRTLVPALFLSLALAGVSACKSEIDDKPKAKVGEAAKVDKTDKADNADESASSTTLSLAKDGSTVGFIGAKVTGDHKGSFKDFEGSATVDGGKLTAMEVTVDMNSLDIEPQGLLDHLKNEDFFDVPNHPKAKFVGLSFTEKPGEGGATHEVAGNLELRGETKQITFPATIHVGEGSVHGKAAFSIERKEWGINYAGKADDLIKDSVALDLDLNFKG